MNSEGIKTVGPRDFQTCVIQVHQMLKRSDEQQHMVWLVQSKFSSMRFINDRQSVEGDVSGSAGAAAEKRAANVILTTRRHTRIELAIGGMVQFLLELNVKLQPWKNFP